MIFPTVRGSNLLRQQVTLPKDFQDKLNLIFIAFELWQQMEKSNQPYGYHIEIEWETAEAKVLNFSIHSKLQAIIDYAGRRPAFSTAC